MSATIQAMHVFVRAVEVNSFIAAARSLLIDPAVVSRTIKALEADLGVLLFARSTRALKLTAEGERYYRDSLEVLHKFEEARRQFRTRPAAPLGNSRSAWLPVCQDESCCEQFLSFRSSTLKSRSSCSVSTPLPKLGKRALIFSFGLAACGNAVVNIRRVRGL